MPAQALGMLAVHAVYGDRNFHEWEREGADCVGIIPWHQLPSPERMTKFVEPLVKCPSGFADVHEEVFAGRADAEGV